MKRYLFNDDLAWFEDFMWWSKPTLSVFKGELYNPETHDIIPKPEFRDKQLKNKQKRLDELTEEKERTLKYYEEREESMKKEIDTLKKELSP